jgi:GT2 family glycosyltransferase
MHQPKVAAVIIHWNRCKLLEQFLPFLMASTYPNLEVYVADNASTDDTIPFLETHYPTVKIIRLDKNYGYAGGYNEALKHVKADYYVLINNDIEVTPGWVEPVIAEMLKDSNIAACQPKLLQYHHKDKFEYAGAAGGMMDSLGYVFCRGRIFEVDEVDKHQYQETTEIFWASGACLFIRAEAFHEVGGFDKHFFAHMEEVDMCWRLQQRGYRIMAVPTSEVYHVGGGTLSKQSPQKTYLNFKNSLCMLFKNLPVSKLIWLIPIRSCLDLLSSIFFLMNGLPLHSWAIHRAHADFFFNLGKWISLRKEAQLQIKTYDLKGTFSGSIVYQHFVKKVRYYSELF